MTGSCCVSLADACDKVLGSEMGEVDIDIALDTLHGREFAEIVNRWMVNESMDMRSIGVIWRNPVQSKHLETASMRVLVSGSTLSTS